MLGRWPDERPPAQRARRRDPARAAARLARAYDAILDAASIAPSSCSARLPAGADGSLPRCSMPRGYWWRIQTRSGADALRCRLHHRGDRRSRRPRPGRRATAGAPRPGSTSAPPTARACSGACCAHERLARRPRRQANQGRARTSAGARARTGRRAVRLGLYQLLADVAPRRPRSCASC